VFEQSTDLAAILSMAIANREEMAMLQAHDVRGGDVSVLISLIGIVSSNSSFCSEREFSYNIANFCLWLSILSWGFSRAFNSGDFFSILLLLKLLLDSELLGIGLTTLTLTLA
jgi:hypothetical protein